MKLLEIDPSKIVVSAELSRSSTSKQFEERLQASIAQIGLAEPLKVAQLPKGRYLVVDGTMRWRAISAIRDTDSTKFPTVPAYIVDYERRYEIRYQTDIYQDLLPSQLAALVEHLHSQENIRKNEIARYIGVSPPTLRNYTGVGRLLQRGGLFARLVELMDVDVVPASNPYAWLRLTDDGVRKVLKDSFAKSADIEVWIDERVARARRDDVAPFPIKFIEAVTGNLQARYYREASEVRTLKRDLGLRRAAAVAKRPKKLNTKDVLQNLQFVSKQSKDPVLRTAARSLQSYLA
jgi:ParB-like chromosome segregation protein Spo0J